MNSSNLSKLCLLVVFVSILTALAFTAPDGNLLEFKKVRDFGLKQFKEIYGVCLDPKENICICGDSLIVIYNKEGKELKRIKTPITARCIACDSKGYFYVGGKDKDKKAKVVKMGIEGNVLMSFGEYGRDYGQMKSPASIVIYKNYILVGDSSNRCIHKYSDKGEFIADLGREKGKNGSFSSCCGILDFDVDKKGKLHVAHLGAHRVEVCDLNGESRKYWGKCGKELPDFCGCCNPVSLAVFGNGNIITTEKTIPRIKVYTKGGKKLLACMGEKDFSKTCGRMDVAVDSKFNIYAVDTATGCVRMFSPPTKSTK